MQIIASAVLVVTGRVLANEPNQGVWGAWLSRRGAGTERANCLAKAGPIKFLPWGGKCPQCYT